jgi:hypothetical protein
MCSVYFCPSVVKHQTVFLGCRSRKPDVRKRPVSGLPETGLPVATGRPDRTKIQPSGHPAGRPAGRPAGHPAGHPAGRSAGRPAGCPAGQLVDR